MSDDNSEGVTIGPAGTVVPWVADPGIVYVGTIEDLPRAQFSGLPDHPGQRQTAVHAVALMGSGVLERPLDQHREVSVILVGDTIAKMVSRYGSNAAGALKRWGYKENGHTRDFVWNLGKPAPETLRCTVYAAASIEAALQSYGAVDSLTAVKARTDIMQSTLRIAGIKPTSSWLRKASGLGPALDLALAVLCGGHSQPQGLQRLVLLSDMDRPPEEIRLHRIVPALAVVQRFREAIEALDRLGPVPSLMPLSPAAYVAGYLSILERDPEEGKLFLEELQRERGEYSGGIMDAFYCVKKVRDEVLDPRRKIKTTSAQRADQILACTLNSYEGWRIDRSFKADDFPTKASVISRFNPLLRKAAQERARALDAQREKEKREGRGIGPDEGARPVA